MNIDLNIRRDSERKRMYRRDNIERLAHRICAGEGVKGESVEISVLFCDDAFIAELNEQYRNMRGATDVLSFEQSESPLPGVRALGDIVISLETVERACAGEPPAMRDEVRLLFCHGLLHLLGYDHTTEAEAEIMNEKQASYLGLAIEAAWRPDRQEAQRAAGGAVRGGARSSVGR